MMSFKSIIKKFLSGFLTSVCTFAFVSCGIITITPANSHRTESITSEQIQTAADTKQSDRFTVSFDDNEKFESEIKKRAAEIIDGSIRKAVVILNSMSAFPYYRLCKSAETISKVPEREKLKYDLSKKFYDEILTAALDFSDWTVKENDYPEIKDFFNVYVSALDALRSDRPEIFLYCDVSSQWENGGFIYYLVYYLPNEWLNNPCENRKAVKDAVALYYAVVDRIIEKAPPEADDFYRCCYFAYVISSVCTYENEQMTVLDPYQAYNVLIKGSAVCHGYADALVELCTKEGIYCECVTGEAPSGGRHAWNKVMTDEGPLYIDVTWFDNDLITDDYRQGKTSYLFMTEQEMLNEGYMPD